MTFVSVSFPTSGPSGAPSWAALWSSLPASDSVLVVACCSISVDPVLVLQNRGLVFLVLLWLIVVFGLVRRFAL